MIHNLVYIFITFSLAIWLMYIIFIVCKWNPHLCPNTVRHLTHNFSHLVETKYMYIHCSVECNLTTLYKKSTSSHVPLSFLLWNNYNLKFIRIERQLNWYYTCHIQIFYFVLCHIYIHQTIKLLIIPITISINPKKTPELEILVLRHSSGFLPGCRLGDLPEVRIHCTS